jgi:protein-tyrosine phosphatase
MTERRLSWEGCRNVRDLGGHPTEDGGETRMGAVVRADSVRQLTEAGWAALVDYGIRTIVDLRLHSELEEDPAGDVPVKVLHVPFFEEISLEEQLAIAERWLTAPDGVTATRGAYLEMLERYRGNAAAAVSVVARAPEGGVLVHCAGGKDRTGLVSALLLRLAGVSIGDVAADYGLSAENLEAMLQEWVEGAGDESERELRRRMGASPADAMTQVLEQLEREHGSVRDYLLDGGASRGDLDRVRSRLRS